MNITYKSVFEKAIYEPHNLTKEEKDFILNHRMSNEQVAQRIEEINGKSSHPEQGEQGELYKKVKFERRI